MTSTHNPTANYWGSLIKPDKSASPVLERLCLGLASIIGKLEPGTGPDNEVSPQRLAAFYRSVGGNYDSLFLKNSDSGLSYIYKTLGCFHSLQPTSSAFETPSVPALLPAGFVRWQTLQLLLCPGEHVPFMQEAVRRYDVPTPDGGVFPKVIPRESFPDRPDEQMERWHKMVTGTLEQAHQTRSLKNSPYASPRDQPNRAEGYFLSNGKLPQVRRPAKTPGALSPDYETAYSAEERRRSSVPDIVSHLPTDHTSRASDTQQFPQPSNLRARSSQYSSSHHASNGSSQHRPSDASSSQPRYSNSSHRTSNSSSTYRPVLSSSVESNKQVPPSSYHRGHDRQRSASIGTHRRSHSSSTVDESTSGSEASSENSQADRGRNSHEARDGRRRSSLFPPNPFKNHLRRHSHDSSYLPNGRPPLPTRPNEALKHRQEPLSSSRPEHAHRNGVVSGQATLNGSGVQFRNNVFEVRGDDAVNSAPESPGVAATFNSSKSPKMRYFDPAGQQQLVRTGSRAGADMSREGSGSGAERERLQRKSGMPLRISTVSGVGGRKYAAAEPRSAFVGKKV